MHKTGYNNNELLQMLKFIQNMPYICKIPIPIYAINNFVYTIILNICTYNFTTKKYANAWNY